MWPRARQKGVTFDTLGLFDYPWRMQLILASQSPYRKALLDNFSLRFTAVAPDVDEAELKSKGPGDLIELTRYLAFHKASSLRGRFPGAVILGSDQLAEIDGARLDKPGTHANALQQLRKLQGRSHRLVTSLTVLAPQAAYTFTDITSVHLRPLKDEFLEAYLQVDKPYDCAGSYKIEKAGMALIARLETQDPSAIQGLPLLSMTEAFNNLDLNWQELWRKT
jgi:septum formation protein